MSKSDEVTIKDFLAFLKMFYKSILLFWGISFALIYFALSKINSSTVKTELDFTVNTVAIQKGLNSNGEIFNPTDEILSPHLRKKIEPALLKDMANEIQITKIVPEGIKPEQVDYFQPDSFTLSISHKEPSNKTLAHTISLLNQVLDNYKDTLNKRQKKSHSSKDTLNFNQVSRFSNDYDEMVSYVELKITGLQTRINSFLKMIEDKRPEYKDQFVEDDVSLFIAKSNLHENVEMTALQSQITKYHQTEFQELNQVIWKYSYTKHPQTKLNHLKFQLASEKKQLNFLKNRKDHLVPELAQPITIFNMANIDKKKTTDQNLAISIAEEIAKKIMLIDQLNTKIDAFQKVKDLKMSQQDHKAAEQVIKKMITSYNILASNYYDILQDKLKSPMIQNQPLIIKQPIRKSKIARFSRVKFLGMCIISSILCAVLFTTALEIIKSRKRSSKYY